MRLLRFGQKFNWKYIVGEILLIFVGISLAIWFNNWNNALTSGRNKKLAISKIKEEINSNIGELAIAQENNQFITQAFTDYQQVYEKGTSTVVTTPKKRNQLNKKYPEFFRATDSVGVEEGKFRYQGRTYIELELPVLTQIAWETTRSINITNEFDYYCLYDLESMYNLQQRVQIEIDKAANALQRGEMGELMRILNFLEQLGTQLMEDYQTMLKEINNCD